MAYSAIKEGGQGPRVEPCNPREQRHEQNMKGFPPSFAACRGIKPWRERGQAPSLSGAGS